ncbi:MAG: methionyl-tRNA formyltransferase [Actinomycetota bacterium]
MRIVFLGNAQWSVPALAALVRSSHGVAAVVTSPPRPAGRGHEVRPNAVGRAARDLGLELVETGDDLVPILEPLAPDVLAVVAFGRILPQAALDLARVAPVNLHFSLLPALRGASPVQSAILAGASRTGVTTIRMVAALDAGPIYGQREATIAPEEDAGALGARLADLGAELLVETVDALAAGSATARPQDDAAATTCRKLGATDRPLRFADEDAVASVRRVRALAPEPGATVAFRGDPLQVLAAREEPSSPAGGPGEVVAVDRDGIVVAARAGAIRFLEVAPAGRRRMAAADFARGARIAVGERFA